MNADPTSESHPEPPSGLPARLAARVESIVRAAEQEALAVQRDLDAQRRLAEEEARRYVDEARRHADSLGQERVHRLRELTDDLVQRAELVKRQLDELAGAIERAGVAVERDPELARSPEEPAPPMAAPRAPAISFRGSEVPPPPRPDATPPDGDGARRDDVGSARLVAIEMAVAGRGRAETERHLRESFGVADVEGLLDDVFGPAETPPPQPR